jgi:ectoine hydroxylase-related dioxygenase (phytanoyl-CoA dioxygenase family)
MNQNYFLDTKNGYGLFKGMLSSNHVDLLIQSYNELDSNIEPSKQILYTHKLPEQQKPSLSKIANQWFNLFNKKINTNLTPCYKELKEKLALVGLNKFLLFQDSIIQKQKTTTPFHWHQDYPYWPINKPQGWTVWIALDEVNESNGKLQIAIGSNKLGAEKAVDLHNGNIQHTDKKPNFSPLNFNIFSPDLSPGDAIFFHGLTYHFSTTNSTHKPRRAWASVWLKDSLYWDTKKAPRHFLCSKINSGDSISTYINENNKT